MLLAGERLGPYEIREPLGTGGMGEVYLAHDPRLGRELALKVLPGSATTEDAAVERFIREARAASALNHPNVVTIYEIGESAHGRYIAMELVRGRTLRTLIDEQQGSAQLVQIGTQVARALAVAHAAGIVHRDVKPDNVMVRADGLVKVLDFGIARLLASQDGRTARPVAAPTQAGLAMGTLRYMSPEQASAEPVSGATDVFALGVMLHELATGQHPFASPHRAASDIALLGAILTAPAPAPSSLNPALPPELDALILEMLEKEPSRRPPAGDVEAALAELAASSRGTVAAAVRRSVAGEQHTVGRERERELLRRALADTSAGRGLLVSVAGEPGIGKSTLVEEFIAEATSATRPPQVARGRCSERLAGTEAYLPIFEALDVLTRGPGAAATISLMKRLAPTWYLQVAPVTVDDSSEGRALTSVQASSQDRMKRELSAFFEELSRAAPVLLFLDDLHWADVSTVDVLAYIGARLDAMRLLVLVTVRPAELLLGKHPFAQLKLDLQARGACREVALEFLTRGDTEQYLQLEFPGHAFPREFPALIHAKTEGSPLFMADMLRYLRTRGVVAQVDGRWTLAQSVPAIEHDLPESIRGMIQRKIEQLGEADRRLLAAASVQGYEFDSAIVAALTAMDPADVEERLETLEHVYGLVRRAREQHLPDGAISVRYRFVHVLYQNTLYTALSPSRRVSLSASAARALLTHHAERAPEIAAELALLFEAARDVPRAVEHVITAARNAARLFANQEAVSLARRGLALLEQLPASDERDQREMVLQNLLATALSATQGLAAAEPGRASARAYELWKQLGARAEHFDVAGGLWVYHVVAGQLEVALTMAKELLRMAEQVGAPPMYVLAHNALGITEHHIGNHLQALDHFDKGLAAYSVELSPLFISILIEPSVGMSSERARTLWVLGYPDQALRQVEEALRLAEVVPHPEARGFAQIFGAFVYQLRGDAEAVYRYTETVLAIARERDIATSLAWGMVLHGWALAMRGDVEAGLAEMRASLDAQLAAGALIARPQFLAILAEACLHAGRYDTVLEATADGLACSLKTADHYWDSELERLRAEALYHLDGDAGEIDACLVRAMDDARARHAKSLELRAAMSAARVWQARGERGRAREPLEAAYAAFSEGFGTADLVAARGLLDSLQ